MECSGDSCNAVVKQSIDVPAATSTNQALLKKKLLINVTSDNICPWCVIGKRRLETALKAVDRTKTEVEVHWKPFMLDGTLPTPGVDKMERYKARFGVQVPRIFAHVQAAGKEVGLDIKYGGKVGNTLNSHRLVRFGKSKGLENSTITAIFESYFEHNEDISDLSVLAIVAERAGLDRAEAATFLASDSEKKETLDEIKEANNARISGVPYFDINGLLFLSGAQEPQTFIEAFKKVDAI